MKSTRSIPSRELLFGDLWEYDPAPETADPQIDSRYGLFIDGKFVAPKTRKYFDSISPRDEKKLSEIALAGPADVEAAYQAAHKAFGSWSKLPGKERGKLGVVSSPEFWSLASRIPTVTWFTNRKNALFCSASLFISSRSTDGRIKAMFVQTFT
jgi:hypothetical protein